MQIDECPGGSGVRHFAVGESRFARVDLLPANTEFDAETKSPTLPAARGIVRQDLDPARPEVENMWNFFSI